MAIMKCCGYVCGALLLVAGIILIAIGGMIKKMETPLAIILSVQPDLSSSTRLCNCSLADEITCLRVSCMWVESSCVEPISPLKYNAWYNAGKDVGGTPKSISTSYYLYNIENPAEVITGSTPKVSSIGPFLTYSYYGKKK